MTYKGIGECHAITLTQGLDTIVGTSGNDTINAYAFNSVTGADVTTLNSVDSIDGGAGSDTLNIEVKDNGAGGDYNDVIQGTIKNVEIININNTAANTAGSIDASKIVGATVINQIGKIADITELGSSTTAAFDGYLDNDVAAADSAASVSLDFTKTDDDSWVDVYASATGKLSTINVTGTMVDVDDDGVLDTTDMHVTVGKDVETLTVNSAANLYFHSITNGAGTKVIKTFDASGSTGNIEYYSGLTDVATISTGSGTDEVEVVTVTAKDNTATTADETVSATVTTNAGDDTVYVNVTGDGKTNVNTGAGADTVEIVGRGTSVLTVDMGDGADIFTSAVAIAATDSIDAGAGSDTLLLSLVGAANVGAFKNFDVYDVKGMTANLDLDLLTTKNTVTEVIGSAALGAIAVTLENVTTGFRATGDVGTTNALTLDQKTAGALTVTLDADETGAADDGAETAGMKLVALDATSVSAVFDTAYLADTTAEAALAVDADNYSTINLTTKAATAATVTSGGTNASNNLVLTDDAATAGKLAALTITGAQALSLTYAATNGSALASIDASALTGGLTASLAALKNGGNLTLGSGADVITVSSASTGAGIESITGFEKTATVAVSTAAGDATAKAAAIAAADVLVQAGASVAATASGATVADVTHATVAKGVLSWVDAGPATLTDAITYASEVANDAGEAVAFEYSGNTYVFVENGATDTVVKLVGITGVTNFVESTTADNFFIV